MVWQGRQYFKEDEMGIYKWGNSYRPKGDAQKIGEWIDSLEEKTPEVIVQKAKNKRCPAHHCFTWEDSEAAEKWRLQEARMLVNAIVVEEESENETVSRPAFESVIIGEQRQYVPTTIESLSDDEIWEQIADEAVMTIRTLQHKLNTYSYIRERKVANAQRHLSKAREAIKA
jgi:hypothetical protein